MIFNSGHLWKQYSFFEHGKSDTIKQDITTANRVNPATCSPYFQVPFHEIHKQCYSYWFKVHIPIQSQQKGVLCTQLLLLPCSIRVHQAMGQEIVHVHHLQQVAARVGTTVCGFFHYLSRPLYRFIKILRIVVLCYSWSCASYIFMKLRFLFFRTDGLHTKTQKELEHTNSPFNFERSLNNSL